MGTIDPAIFKSYDIRGVFPETLNPAVAERIGSAIATHLNAKSLAVGRDMRESSRPLFEGLAKGITRAGCKVVDLGLISTDMIYFASGHVNVDGGVMITASHNPGKDNGIKLCGKRASPIGMGTGLEAIRDASMNEIPQAVRPGKMERADLYPAYIQKCLSFISPASLRPLRVVVDAGNGMGGMTWPNVQNALPVCTIPLYFELDGTFPHHVPNPLLPENLVALQNEVRSVQADLGIAFDGDADRVALVDEKGIPVTGSEVTALVSEYLLSQPTNTGATILYDLRSSKIVPETILAKGGKPFMTRVGHSPIKKIMNEKQALFAGELSGHYYFRENFNADSGMIAALILLQIISQKNKPLSTIMAPFRTKWFHSGEINFTVSNKEEKIRVLKNEYAPLGNAIEMDGFSLDAGEWWFNVRPSNTEPFLRLNVEARSPSILAQKLGEISQILQK